MAIQFACGLLGRVRWSLLERGALLEPRGSSFFLVGGVISSVCRGLYGQVVFGGLLRGVRFAGEIRWLAPSSSLVARQGVFFVYYLVRCYTGRLLRFFVVHLLHGVSLFRSLFVRLLFSGRPCSFLSLSKGSMVLLTSTSGTAKFLNFPVLHLAIFLEVSPCPTGLEFSSC